VRTSQANHKSRWQRSGYWGLSAKKSV
jgi:hypothetical protein